ncbi:MAG: hypothetical protein LBJ24_00525 [Treponema sp.]|jgi:hypothetical protein|nr:hypothetical protein [Treponema sp.]
MKQCTAWALALFALAASPAAGADPSLTVYAAGWYHDGNTAFPYYWKDGTKTRLPGGSENEFAASVAVVGGSVYAAGRYYEGGAAFPCYWKDGIRAGLPGGGFAESITGAGGLLYVAGGEYAGAAGTAWYWDGVTRTDIPLSVPREAASVGIATVIVVEQGAPGP